MSHGLYSIALYISINISDLSTITYKTLFLRLKLYFTFKKNLSSVVPLLVSSTYYTDGC